MYGSSNCKFAWKKDAKPDAGFACHELANVRNGAEDENGCRTNREDGILKSDCEVKSPGELGSECIVPSEKWARCHGGLRVNATNVVNTLDARTEKLSALSRRPCAYPSGQFFSFSPGLRKSKSKAVGGMRILQTHIACGVMQQHLVIQSVGASWVRGPTNQPTQRIILRQKRKWRIAPPTHSANVALYGSTQQAWVLYRPVTSILEKIA